MIKQELISHIVMKKIIMLWKDIELEIYEHRPGRR